MILVQPQFRGRALMAICETGSAFVWLCLFGAPWAAADRWPDPLQLIYLPQNGEAGAGRACHQPPMPNKPEDRPWDREGVLLVVIVAQSSLRARCSPLAHCGFRRPVVFFSEGGSHA